MSSSAQKDEETVSIWEEILWTGKVLDELARLAEDRDGQISHFALQQLAAVPGVSHHSQEGLAEGVTSDGAEGSRPPSADDVVDESAVLEHFVKASQSWTSRALSSVAASASAEERVGGSSLESSEEDLQSILTPHERLLRLPLEPRVFRGMLLSVKSSPALYRAVLSHPFLLGKVGVKGEGAKKGSSASASGKSHKKKRKEKEKHKHQQAEGVEVGNKGEQPGSDQQPEQQQLPPHFQMPVLQQSEPLEPAIMREQAATLAARAVLDRSAQAMLVAAKTLLASYLGSKYDSAKGVREPASPSASHVEKLGQDFGGVEKQLPVGAVLGLLFPPGEGNPFDAARRKAQEAIKKERARKERAEARAKEKAKAAERESSETAGCGSCGDVDGGGAAGAGTPAPSDLAAPGKDEGSAHRGEVAMEEDEDDAALLEEAIAMSVRDSNAGQEGESSGASQPEDSRMDISAEEVSRPAHMDVDNKPGQTVVTDEEDDAMEQDDDGEGFGEQATALEEVCLPEPQLWTAQWIRQVLPMFKGVRGQAVSADVAILAFLGHLDEEATAYKAQLVAKSIQDAEWRQASCTEASKRSTLPQPPDSIQPHALTFMLLHSLLNDLLSLLTTPTVEDDRSDAELALGFPLPEENPALEGDFCVEDDMSASSSPLTKKLRLPTVSETRSPMRRGRRKDVAESSLKLFAAAAAVSTLRILDANLLYVARMGLGASVGLGSQVATPSPSSPGSSPAVDSPASSGVKGPSDTTASTTGPAALFVSRLRATVERCMEIDVLYGSTALRTEAMNAWTTGLEFFYPRHEQRQKLLLELLSPRVPPMTGLQKDRERMAAWHEAQRERLLQRLCLRLAQPDVCPHFFALPTEPASQPGEESEGMLTRSQEEEMDRDDSVSSLLSALTTSGTSTGGGEGKGHSRVPPVMDMLLEQLADPWTAAKGRGDGVQHAKLALLSALQSQLVNVLVASSGRDTQRVSLDFDPKRISDTITLSNGGRTATQRGSKAWGSVMASTGFAPNTGVHQWLVRLERCDKGHVFIGVCTSEASTKTYVGGDRHGWGMIGTKALWHNRSKVRSDFGEGFASRCIVRVRLDTDKGTLSLGLGSSADWGAAFEKLPKNEVLYPAVGLYQRDDQVTILPVAGGTRGSVEDAAERAMHARRASQTLTPVIAYTEKLVHGAHQVLDVLEEAGDKEGKSLCARHPILQRLLPQLTASLCLLPSLPSGMGTLALTLLPSVTTLIKRLDKLSTRGGHGQVPDAALFVDMASSWMIKSAAADSIPAQTYSLQLVMSTPSTVKTPLLSPAVSSSTHTGTGYKAVHGEGAGQESRVAVEGAVLGTRLRLLESWLQGGSCVVEGRLRLDGGAFVGTFRDTRSSTIGNICGRRQSRQEDDGDTGLCGLGRLEAILALLAGKLCCGLMVGLEDARDVPLETFNTVEVVTEEEEDESKEGVEGGPGVAPMLSRGVSAGPVETSVGGSSRLGDDSTGATSMVTIDEDSKTQDEVDEALLETIAKWRCSRLLSAGLPLRATIDSLRAKLEEQTNAPESCQQWWGSLVLRLPTEQEASLHEQGFGELDPAIGDLMGGQGWAAEADAWVQRHVGDSVFTRVGGQAMRTARFAILAALVRHGGALERLKREWEVRCVGAQERRPSNLLVQIWRAAQRTIESAVRQKQTSGLTFSGMAEMLEHKAKFLLQVLPCTLARRLCAELAGPAIESLEPAGSPPAGTTMSAAEEQCAGLLAEAIQFFESRLRDTELLRRDMLCASLQAFDRAVGLRALHVLLGTSFHAADNSALTAPPGSDRLLCMGPAVAATLQYLSPALIGHADPFNISDGVMSSLAYPSVGTLHGGASAAGHFLDGLEACGSTMQSEVRSAFERLYSLLVQLLERAISSGDLDTSLLILQSWGLALRPEDHSFLSRVGVFRAVQVVLDAVRPSGRLQTVMAVADNTDSSQGSAAKTLEKMMNASRTRVARAALKVVHLLAAQVAALPDAQKNGDKMLLLTPQPSGPDTLSAALFDMLHTELTCAVRHVVDGLHMPVPSDPASISSSPSECPLSADSAPRAGTADDDHLSAEQYCHRLLGLLQSVCSSAVCRRHLAQRRWQRLFLAGLQAGGASMQRRIFRLLRLLLPSIEAQAFRVKIPRPQAGESRREQLLALLADTDADSEDVLSDPDNDALRSLFDLLFEAVSTPLPQSLERHAVPPLTCSFASEASQLWNEAVALLRTLLTVKSWAGTMRELLLSGLRDIGGVLHQPDQAPADETDYTDLRPRLAHAMAVVSVLGGLVEELRVGGMVTLRPQSLYGLSDTLALRLAAMAQTSGILVSYSTDASDRRTAEVIMVERKDKRGLALPTGLPIRAVKINADDLVAVPEVDVPLSVIDPDVVAALLQAVVEHGVVWLMTTQASIKAEAKLQTYGGKTVGGQPQDMAPAEENAEEESKDEAGEQPVQEDSGAAGSPAEERDNKLWDVRAAQGRLVLQAFKAAAEALSYPPFCSALLARPGGEAALRSLLSAAAAHTSTGGLGNLHAHQDIWLSSWRAWRESFLPKSSEPTGAGTIGGQPPGPPPDRSSAAGTGAPRGDRATTAASSLSAFMQAVTGDPGAVASAATAQSSANREASIQQMMEMGFTREWCEAALRRCGNNVEVAVNYCFEHSGEMEQILAEEQAIAAAAAAVAQRGGGTRSVESVRRSFETSILLSQLQEMGFPRGWCSKALALNHNNVNAALTWILSNAEMLAAADEAAEDAVAESTEGHKEGAEETEDDTQAVGPNPLRVISGAADIRPDLSVEGVANGGFASVGCRGCLVTSGKWVYEAVVRTAGCMQIGWCDATFQGDAVGGDGVGDGPHSWAYDGWREYKWHDGHVEWGTKWKPGDVVGCLVDLDNNVMSFTLNGHGEEIGMGTAFADIRYSGGLYPCASFNRREKMQFNFGGRPFRHEPPPGYRPYIEAVQNAVAELVELRESVGLEHTPLYKARGESISEGMDVVEEEGEGGQDAAVETMETLPSKTTKGSASEEPVATADYLEDCMEEEVGAEALRWQHRHFTPDSTSRSQASGSRSRGHVRVVVKVDVTSNSDGKTLVREAVELSVLYARKAVLTVLSSWPAHRAWDLTRLLTPVAETQEAEEHAHGAGDLVQLLRLVSTVSPSTLAHLSKAALVPLDLLGPEAYLESALHAGGAPTLYALTPALSDALRNAPVSVLEPLARCVMQEVYLAMDRQALATVSAMSGGRGAGGSGEYEQPTDEELLQQPNLCLAVWATGLLLTRQRLCPHAVLTVSRAWALAMRSPSVQLKTAAASMLSSMLQEAVMMSRTRHTTEASSSLLPSLLACLDQHRIRALALRRVWSERSAHPIYSRYAQTLAELMCSMTLAHEALGEVPQQQQQQQPSTPPDPSMLQELPPASTTDSIAECRAWTEALSMSDQGWQQWTGTVTQHAAEWRCPTRPPARQQTAEGTDGPGPPPLLAGCQVVRGPDWVVEREGYGERDVTSVGTVEEVVDWEGQESRGRRVVWSDGEVGTYRWGADGYFDLTHVEMKADQVVKRHPHPETLESIAARKGFGSEQHYGIILWIRPSSHTAAGTPEDPTAATPFEGICEWPDHAAASWVQGQRTADGSMSFTEVRLLVGLTSSGWNGRFGTDEWRAGITYSLAPSYDGAEDDGVGMRLLGEYSFKVRLGGEEVEVHGDVRLQQKDLFTLDWYAKAEVINVSEDGRSASCTSSESKSLIYGSVGFSRGVHYWEVKIEQEEMGSLFLGVAEKPHGPLAASRVTRWHGWGFINYRAAFAWTPGDSPSALQTGTAPERVYGDNFHFGDIVGVKLDMERGVLSFFLDGMKYGEHILSDLGVAHEGLLGNKARAKPRVLFPVMGFRKKGDRVTLTGRWMSTPGVHPRALLDDVTATGSLLQAWEEQAVHVSRQEDTASGVEEAKGAAESVQDSPIPQWAYEEAWKDWRQWRSGRWRRVLTRAQSSALVDVDTSVDACVRASLLMGLRKPLLAGDRVRITRRCGRVLEQPEARVVLGAYRGMLWYQIDSQREGTGTDGASLAWCWLPCDVDGLELLTRSRRGVLPLAADDVDIELLPVFKGGKLRVVYDQAVIREGLEIDTSDKVGEVEHGAVIDALERRVNSSNIARYRIRHRGVEGWISERIRGESEDLIVVRMGGEKGGDEGGAPDDTSTQPSSDLSHVASEEKVQAAVMKWKRDVAAHMADQMDTGSALPSLDPDALWCWGYLEGVNEGLETEAEKSLNVFRQLAGGRWSLEADCELAQLLCEAAELQGEAPMNMSYHMLRESLLCAHDQDVHDAASALARGELGPLAHRPHLRDIALEKLLARASLLRILNERLARALPVLSLALPEVDWEKEQVGYSELVVTDASLQPPQVTSSDGFNVLAHTFRAAHACGWKPRCMARRLRLLRRLIFTHTKRAFWESVLAATTTPTQLHQDEYEDPREIKTIKINRIRASASRLALVRNINERLRLSVFGQLHKEMRTWPSSSFRRAYLGKGHGGQRRAFKVKFMGEGVNDYGGPYRAVFEQIVDELQDDRMPVSPRPGEKCLLPLLVPCPNRQGAVGPNQDKFVLAPGQPTPLALELMQLLGKLVGMALRHGLPMGLDLPATVWRPLVGLPLSREHLESFDLLATRTLEQVESTGEAATRGDLGDVGGRTSSSPGGSELLVPEGWEDLSFTTHLSDGTSVKLRAPDDVEGDKVTIANWRNYVRLVEDARLKESAAMLSAFQDGLAVVLPQELFPLFTDTELERLMCGIREVDVTLLRQCTDYEDVNPSAPHITAFWEVLSEMTPEERTEFLRFTWARSRMPSSAKDFPMNFKIQAPQGGAKDSPDSYLPHAQTCFFSLSLPHYSSKEVLKEKLLLAVRNSPNMDADVRLHNAEGWAE